MKIDPKKTVFLIDGSSFLYRAYYSLKPMHTAQGEAIQAVYGFCRMIKKLLKTFKPEYIALVWDSKGKTTRHEIYTEYKATRQAAPSDMFDQKEHILEFADMIGLTQLAEPGVEADDIMYSLAKDFSKEGFTSVFVTLDKDMGQAITDKVILFDPFKYQFIDKAAFEEKMGFPVEKMPFYFAMLGDVSDNIPGVRGIGKKTAQDLVNQFDSLEDMYANLHKIKKARIENALIKNKDNAFLSRKLFLLQYKPTGLNEHDVSFNVKNWVKARPLFEKLNFKSLLKDLGVTKEMRADLIQEKINYWKKYNFKSVITRKELDDLVALLKEKKVFAFDTETNGLKPLQVDLVGMSFCVEEGTAYYVPCGHKTNEQQLERAEVLEALRDVFEDPQYKIYMHNANYDQLVLSGCGIEVTGLALDTLVASSLVIKDWQRPGLKSMSVYYFDEQMLSYQDVVKHFKYKDFSYVPIELATIYSATDAHQTLRLGIALEEELKKEGMRTLYDTIEHPLVFVLYKMERKGIGFDKKVIKEIDVVVTKAIAKIENDIQMMIGEGGSINLNSPRQVERLLFEVLELPPQKKSAKGTGYSTDQEVLRILADMHAIPALILKYRELAKLKSTYIDALPAYINPKTGRIHTTFRQTGVATGRLASSDPNLQNIPASGVGLQVRHAFKPVKNNVFISADYSQIELRVLAHLSQDANLIHAFLQGHDIHAETASRLFDVTLDNVTHEQRQIGKRINFSILYGLTPYGLSKDLGISFKDAKQYIDKYFAQYPKVSEWMEKVIAFTKEHGYIQTLWGRRRYVPGIYEDNKTLYDEACRVAINTVAQGTASEIMKQGMINLEDAFERQQLDAYMLLQIHDELLISVPGSEKDKTEKLIINTLESVVDWKIPLVVKTRSGADWFEVSK